MQAGYISLLKKEDIKQALTFFDKAYAIGNKKEQSRTALFAAMGSLHNEDAKNVKQWTHKIHDGDYDYDKLSLLAISANYDKKWEQLNEYLQKIVALPTQQGIFFNSVSPVSQVTLPKEPLDFNEPKNASEFLSYPNAMNW